MSADNIAVRIKRQAQQQIKDALLKKTAHEESAKQAEADLNAARGAVQAADLMIAELESEAIVERREEVERVARETKARHEAERLVG